MATSTEELRRMIEDHDRLLIELRDRLDALEEEVKRVLGDDALTDE